MPVLSNLFTFILRPGVWAIFMVSCTLTQRSTSAALVLPYPSSPIIADVQFDWSTHVRMAPGSDNWPITWANNGHQYTSWGDGGGFGGTNSDGRVSLGVGRVEAGWENFSGHNVWGGKDPENQAQFSGKSYGIISIEGVLYMWVSPGSGGDNYNEARLAFSTDYGVSWNKLDWAFPKADGLVLPTFLQFGQDYNGARDDYVYSYFISLKDATDLKVQKPGEIYLVRVPSKQIKDRDAYWFYQGIDVSGNDQWTADINDKHPVFKDQNGVGWNLSASFNSGLGRYILMTEHEQSFKGNLGIFDAQEPWGPWTTVAYYSNWGDTNNTFFWNFSNKWLSEDGKEFTIIYTGIKEHDSWNSVRGRFEFKPTGTPSAYLPLAIKK